MTSVGPGRLIDIPQRLNPRELENRPARRQAIHDAKRVEPVVDGTIYNIWYNKYQGGDRIRGQQVERANGRCVLLRDAGRTKARPHAFFCIHFARGLCSKGSECQFVHSAPTEEFEEKQYDCFGRERHRDERDDMGGVGSFEKENRTIYVGHVTIKANCERIVAKHFSEWGEIEYIRILQDKNVAFVRYKLRACAEFAKEAMFGQALDDNEVLNLRWATEDPNPKVKEMLKQQNEKRVLEAVQKTLPQVGEKGTILDYQNHYAQEDKKQKQIEDAQDSPRKKTKTNQEAPQTNAEEQQMDPEAYAQYCAQYYAYYYGQHYDPSVFYPNAGYSYDNNAFACTDDSAAPTAEENKTTEQPTKTAQTKAPAALAQLAAYGSDDESS